MSTELLTELIREVRGLRRAVEKPGQIDHNRPLTRTEAAEYLQMHPDTVYRLATEGMIAYSRLGDGGRAPLRFTRADLDDFMATHRIATVEDTAARL